jgi:hypothetical protein
MTSISNHLKKQKKPIAAKQAPSKVEKPTKAPQKKLLSHQSTSTKQKKPSMIKKMVEPISKRKLAWETTEEEGKNDDPFPTCA